MFLYIPNKLFNHLLNHFFTFQNNRFFRLVSVSLFRLVSTKGDFRIWIKGHRMHANTFDRIIVLLLWRLSFLEDFESKIINNIIKEGMTIIDVGSNIGFHTLQFAKLVGSKGKVFAFEPDYENFCLLKKNIKENNYQNIIAEKKAISDKTGEAKLYICEEHKGDHRIFYSGDDRKVSLVETTTLDDFFKNEKIDIDFIKLDIQARFRFTTSATST